jgi:hypothetical protein
MPPVLAALSIPPEPLVWLRLPTIGAMRWPLVAAVAVAAEALLVPAAPAALAATLAEGAAEAEHP